MYKHHEQSRSDNIENNVNQRKSSHYSINEQSACLFTMY